MYSTDPPRGCSIGIGIGIGIGRAAPRMPKPVRSSLLRVAPGDRRATVKGQVGPPFASRPANSRQADAVIAWCYHWTRRTMHLRIKGVATQVAVSEWPTMPASRASYSASKQAQSR